MIAIFGEMPGVGLKIRVSSVRFRPPASLVSTTYSEAIWAGESIVPEIVPITTGVPLLMRRWVPHLKVSGREKPALKGVNHR